MLLKKPPRWLKICSRGLPLWPCGPVVKSPPANAKDRGSTPGTEDPTCCRALKPTGHRTAEPERRSCGSPHGPVVGSKRSHSSKQPPLATTRESNEATARVQQRRPRAAKKEILLVAATTDKNENTCRKPSECTGEKLYRKRLTARLDAGRPGVIPLRLSM